MRRTCGGEKIFSSVLIHVGGFNLSLVTRQLLGKGTPSHETLPSPTAHEPVTYTPGC